MLKALAKSAGLASRERKWTLYSELFPPREGERVLDVGVSRFDDLAWENYFLRNYPYPQQLTGVGISDLSILHDRYPGVTFVQADGRELPYEDRSFDIVHSNAVIEHVGPAPEQARFVAELVRVARAGFLTTPARWFPVESHTHVVLGHWLPRGAVVPLMRRLGHTDETGDWPVWLLSGRQFRGMFPPGLELKLIPLRMAGMPATLVVAFRHPGA